MTKIEKSLVESGRFKPIEGAPRHEHEVDAWRKCELVGAEPLAEPALGAGAGDGVADRGARGDEAGAGGHCGLLGGYGRGGEGRHRGAGLRRSGSGRAGFIGRAKGRGCARGVIKHKGAAIEAAPLGADVVKIGRPTQVLVGAKAHDV